MITIKKKITVDIEKRKSKGELISINAPIFLRLTYSGNRINLYSGFRVDLDLWDNENKKVIDGAINENSQTAEEINLNIEKYISEINSLFFTFQIKDEIPAVNEIKVAFEKIKNGSIKPASKKKNKERAKLSFFDVLDEFTSYNGKINNWTNDTFTKFNTLKTHLLNYNENLEFDDLTDEGLSDLLGYFMHDLQMRNTTTKKYLEFISWFLRYALAKDHTTNNAFVNFKPKLKRVKKKIVFLTEDEINQIKETEIPENKQYLIRVRDVLLFLIYSGLRHSDVYKLKKSEIKDGKFEVTTLKTTDSLVIDLNNTSLSILEKYKDVPLQNNKALPVISNQKMNEYLKELGELAEINESINDTYFIGNKRYDESKPKYEYMTSHIGRRSFICLCIAKGIPVQIIMKWTGHSDYKSMIPYIEVSEKTKEIEMKKLNF